MSPLTYEELESDRLPEAEPQHTDGVRDLGKSDWDRGRHCTTCAVLHSIALYYIALHCSTLHCTVVHSIAL